MKEKVYNALIDMGAPIKTRGAQYIVEAMCIYDSADEWTQVRTMDLYAEIAKRYGTEATRVERDIRYAFLKCVSNASEKAVEKYFGGNTRGNTNRLAALYIKLKRED